MNYQWRGGPPPYARTVPALEGPARILCLTPSICDSRIEFIAERNHHWSSRWGTDRNRALWSAFTIVLPGGNIFFAGDTGYGDGSWPKEAARRGPYRLAILPVGAYEPRDVMQANHMNPEEAVAVFETLDPKMALGMHWGTFQLTFEAIDDPPRRLAAARRARGIADGRFVTTEVGRTFAVP
ncbi:MAG TPA: MBL fold metallo-hydrolase [Allosphingosinicella sp.]